MIVKNNGMVNMELLGEILMIFSVCLIIICICMILRNNKVYKERTLQHDVIFAKNDDGRYMNSYESIKKMLEYRDSLATYQQALHRFWKPVDKIYESFYDKVHAGEFNER